MCSNIVVALIEKSCIVQLYAVMKQMSNKVHRNKRYDGVAAYLCEKIPILELNKIIFINASYTHTVRILTPTYDCKLFEVVSAQFQQFILSICQQCYQHWENMGTKMFAINLIYRMMGIIRGRKFLRILQFLMHW